MQRRVLVYVPIFIFVIGVLNSIALFYNTRSTNFKRQLGRALAWSAGLRLECSLGIAFSLEQRMIAASRLWRDNQYNLALVFSLYLYFGT
jgi:hypothetical protein